MPSLGSKEVREKMYTSDQKTQGKNGVYCTVLDRKHYGIGQVAEEGQ